LSRKYFFCFIVSFVVTMTEQLLIKQIVHMSAMDIVAASFVGSFLASATAIMIGIFIFTWDQDTSSCWCSLCRLLGFRMNDHRHHDLQDDYHDVQDDDQEDEDGQEEDDDQEEDDQEEQEKRDENKNVKYDNKKAESEACTTDVKLPELTISHDEQVPDSKNGSDQVFPKNGSDQVFSKMTIEERQTFERLPPIMKWRVLARSGMIQEQGNGAPLNWDGTKSGASPPATADLPAATLDPVVAESAAAAAAESVSAAAATTAGSVSAAAGAAAESVSAVGGAAAAESVCAATCSRIQHPRLAKRKAHHLDRTNDLSPTQSVTDASCTQTPLVTK